MEVLAFHRDEAVLELLVHFLGIATHHNINAAPSKVSTDEVKLRAVKQLSGCCQTDSNSSLLGH
jgi:hypothetical protein